MIRKFIGRIRICAEFSTGLNNVLDSNRPTYAAIAWSYFLEDVGMSVLQSCQLFRCLSSGRDGWKLLKSPHHLHLPLEWRCCGWPGWSEEKHNVIMSVCWTAGRNMYSPCELKNTASTRSIQLSRVDGWMEMLFDWSPTSRELLPEIRSRNFGSLWTNS